MANFQFCGEFNTISNIFHLLVLMKLVTNFNEKKLFILHYSKKSTPYLQKKIWAIYSEVGMKLLNFFLWGKYVQMSQGLGYFFLMKLVNKFTQKKNTIPFPQIVEFFPQNFILGLQKFYFYVENLVQFISKIWETTIKHLTAFSS